MRIIIDVVFVVGVGGVGDGDTAFDSAWGLLLLYIHQLPATKNVKAAGLSKLLLSTVFKILMLLLFLLLLFCFDWSSFCSCFCRGCFVRLFCCACFLWLFCGLVVVILWLVLWSCCGMISLL